ncbi:MAG: hypothetical protein IJI06_03295 [Oscillospiraceae bacterium]|nr:hypothetical protein [Oscillospiraceae bacterium]
MARFQDLPLLKWEVYHPTQGLAIVRARDQIDAIREAALAWGVDPYDDRFLDDVMVMIHVEDHAGPMSI